MNAGEEKAARTHKASRQIMDAEIVSREKKTARRAFLAAAREVDVVVSDKTDG